MSRKKSMFCLSKLLNKFLDLDMVRHILCASIVRLLLVIYGMWHDKYSEVPYTDIDYKVFTDAARNVVNGSSPYKRHTFRYSPLIAFLLTPNVFFHPVFGKIIFCEVDLIVAYFIRRLVYHNILQWMCLYAEHITTKEKLSHGQKEKNQKLKVKSKSDVQTAIFWAHRAMLFWLYNPMTVAISTRGNSDSIACLLVLLTLYCLQVNQHPFKVGLLHGLSIHFRLYPIIYSLTFFMHLSKFSYYFDANRKTIVNKNMKNGNKRKKLRNSKKELIKKNCGQNIAPHYKNKHRKTIFKKELLFYLIPNVHQIMLISGTLTSLLGLTGIFYFLYGYEFLHESFIYHFIRTDFKHNFSLYFYIQYLMAWIKFDVWSMNIWQMILMNLPPIILLLYFSVRYGLNKFSLNFAILVQTIVFVIYNKVLTSQYFVWIIGLLPLCIWQIKLTQKSVIALTFIWFAAQAAWLLPAYLLEFQGENTFVYIWIQGVSLFCAHIGILGRLIKNFVLIEGEFNKIE